MPVKVQKVVGWIRGGKKFAVVDASGKRHGTHKTKAEAIKQAQAINGVKEQESETSDRPDPFCGASDLPHDSWRS